MHERCSLNRAVPWTSPRAADHLGQRIFKNNLERERWVGREGAGVGVGRMVLSIDCGLPRLSRANANVNALNKKGDAWIVCVFQRSGYTHTAPGQSAIHTAAHAGLDEVAKWLTDHACPSFPVAFALR